MKRLQDVIHCKQSHIIKQIYSPDDDSKDILMMKLYFFRSYKKFNAITFVDYLEAARKKFGKISVIADRAPQSKCYKKISA